MSDKYRVGDGTPGPGRPVGSSNKLTKALKQMILGALDDVGGQEYLRRMANENPVAFMALLGRILPTTLSGDPENPVRVITQINLVPVEPRQIEAPPVSIRSPDAITWVDRGFDG